MPLLVQFLLRNAAIGFGLGVVFVAGLLALDANGLRSLMLASDKGGLALFILTFFSGLTFASVQIGVAVMLLGEDDDPEHGPYQIWAKAYAKFSDTVRAWLHPPRSQALIPVRVRPKRPDHRR